MFPTINYLYPLSLLTLLHLHTRTCMSCHLYLISWRDLIIRLDKIINSIERNLEVSADFFHTSFCAEISIDPLWNIWKRGFQIVRKHERKYETCECKDRSLDDREIHLVHTPYPESDDRTCECESESIKCSCQCLDDEEDDTESDPKK